ncbi:hypothetical protein JTE90_018114 [Oedothorax gibbosus]|uniref:Uncharacterized protein n=1 Tax=Oedothorax gibbosus TaxID=931172 RepID=A0AAV6V0T3_9ARAC|nr:hypothetical protein JTE90_018114 [Oedothorax gibbosus]
MIGRNGKMFSSKDGECTRSRSCDQMKTEYPSGHYPFTTSGLKVSGQHINGSLTRYRHLQKHCGRHLDWPQKLDNN